MDGVVLTAAHVVSPFHTIPIVGEKRIGYSWEDMAGNRGYVTGAGANLHRDLGVLSVKAGAPVFYEHASDGPKAGDTLQWVEFDFGSKEDAYAPALRSAVLVRAVAGHLILNPVPTRGASGTCVFNSRSKVVGIIVRGTPVGKNREEWVGVIVDVSGQWWPISQQKVK